MDKIWPRIIAHVDMDAFFASIEQRDFPELRGKPVAVINGVAGSTIITRSYEARAYGIKTGMRLIEARQLCPTLISRPSRPSVYAAVSRQIIDALKNFTPDIEVFSVDEAYLEFTYCTYLHNASSLRGSPRPRQSISNDWIASMTRNDRTILNLAQKIQQKVFEVSKLNCSIGFSGNKSTAKYASNVNKPNGIKIIPPWEAKQQLANAPVSDICGIGKQTAKFLAQYGVYYCGDIEKIPINVLSKRFGNVGRRIWLMCQGLDLEPLQTELRAPKSLGHGKVLPPNTRDKEKILYFLCHMAEKVGARLRENKLESQHFWIGIRLKHGWIATHIKLTHPTQDGNLIYKTAKRLVELEWNGEGVFKCQITAVSPQPENMQMDLFDETPRHCESSKQSIFNPPPREQINKVTDEINQRFGKNSLVCAKRLVDLEVPDVISPAWRPERFK